MSGNGDAEVCMLSEQGSRSHARDVPLRVSIRLKRITFFAGDRGENVEGETETGGVPPRRSSCRHCYFPLV
jgi:hypothetical protein